MTAFGAGEVVGTCFRWEMAKRMSVMTMTTTMTNKNNENDD